MPSVGEIPFVKVDDNCAAVCVEFSELDIRELKANRNRLFLIVPLVPPAKDRPAHVVVYPKDPFITPMTIDGKED